LKVPLFSFKIGLSALSSITLTPLMRLSENENSPDCHPESFNEG